MIECRHRGRKRNGDNHIDPGESQGMQAVGRRHQFLSGRRTHHDVRIGIEGDHNCEAVMVTGVAHHGVNKFAVSPMHAIEHADANRGST